MTDQNKPEVIAEEDLDAAQGGIKGDHLRAANPSVDYTGVKMQQGRVTTDADLNERAPAFDMELSGFAPLKPAEFVIIRIGQKTADAGN